MSPVVTTPDSVPQLPVYDLGNSFTAEELQDGLFLTEEIKFNAENSFALKGEEENYAKRVEEQQQQPESEKVSESDTDDSSWTKKKPVIVTSQNHQRIDFIDLLDTTGGLVHHESPYDCVLPHRNVNSKAPILAFGQIDDIFQPDTQDQDLNEKYPAKKHASYSVNYRDSFLEGSSAYGIHPPKIPEKAKRNSIFNLKRLISSRRKGLDSQEEKNDNSISSRKNAASSRVEVLKSSEY
ncbi:1956_t:CDS:2 [Acaulospora morrowiae]|uniref:1956_t:CDS:1 n=1 Tax=Acaulospora morrowiae TaxID=94023 RepID=A0A9N9G700_9GLOM|nr:1956_t:CDS:2 [Acaulospora morrowiae]